MPVQETSRLAYHDIELSLGSRQKIVLASLRLIYAKEGAQTNGELSYRTNIPINALTPRIFELRGVGLVVMAGKRLCSRTGRTCLTWRPATREEYELRGTQIEMPI